MTEKIEVKSVPLLSLGGKVVYHGTLVYTNSSGQQFFSGGDIGNTALSKEDRRRPDIVAQGEVAVLFGIGTSPYGNLVTATGAVTDLASADHVSRWLPTTAQTILLAQGASLASNWAIITDAMGQINVLAMPYGPVTQNSNSAWCTAAVMGGVITRDDITSKFGPYSGTNWVQGCTVLPSVTVEEKFFKASQANVDGVQMITIEPTDQYGGSLATINISEINQEVITANEDSTWNHFVSGNSLVVSSDNDSYYVSPEAEITINGAFNMLNLRENASLVVKGSNNDIYTSSTNEISLAGNENWIKAITDIYVGGTGSNNSVGMVPQSSNVTVVINGESLMTSPYTRSQNESGNSFSGAHYALDATNTLKWPESPTAPNPV